MKKSTEINPLISNRLIIKTIGLLLLLLFAAGCATSGPSVAPADTEDTSDTKTTTVTETVTVTVTETKTPVPTSINIVDLPATNTDGAIDIQPYKTYTHAIDFGTNAPAVINGVAFDQGPTETLEAPFEGVSSQGYGYIIDDSRAPNYFKIKPHGGNDPEADGNSAEMLRDMIFYSNAQGSIGASLIITLLDLVPETAYSVRYYYRTWDGDSPRPLIISNEKGESIDVDIDGPGAHYLDYTFTADDSDLTLKFAYFEDNQGAHIYGLTCEVVSQ